MFIASRKHPRTGGKHGPHTVPPGRRGDSVRAGPLLRAAPRGLEASRETAIQRRALDVTHRHRCAYPAHTPFTAVIGGPAVIDTAVDTRHDRWEGGIATQRPPITVALLGILRARSFLLSFSLFLTRDISSARKVQRPVKSDEMK